MVHGSASLRYNKGHRVGGHFALPEKSAALIGAYRPVGWHIRLSVYAKKLFYG
jgi:hypothetical protein